MKKSLSPLIAEVMIIGIVFGLFVVLHSWSGGFIHGMQESSETKIQKRLDCSLGSITIRNAIYNSTSGKLYVLVRNDGQVDFSNLTISVMIDNDIQNFDAVSLTADNTLPSGEERSYVVDLSNGCNLQLIRVNTECTSIYDTISSEKVTFYGC